MEEYKCSSLRNKCSKPFMSDLRDVKRMGSKGARKSCGLEGWGRRDVSYNNLSVDSSENTKDSDDGTRDGMAVAKKRRSATMAMLLQAGGSL